MNMAPRLLDLAPLYRDLSIQTSPTMGNRTILSPPLIIHLSIYTAAQDAAAHHAADATNIIISGQEAVLPESEAAGSNRERMALKRARNDKLWDVRNPNLALRRAALDLDKGKQLRLPKTREQ